MKMLLINPPMQINRMPEIPSFGMAYIIHELRSAGHLVEYLDIDANRHDRGYVSDFIAGSDADIVGIGGLVTVYPYLKWLVPELKRIRPGIKVILGGPIASSLRERCFETLGIDFEVIGEGEITIVELLKEISSGRNFGSVNGIAYKKAGGVVFTPNRQLMASLEKIPMFDDTIFPMEKLLHNTDGVFQIHAQRGCPSNCTFCFNAYRVISQHVRYRPVKSVVGEIAHFKNKYGDKIKLFAISGECITMNREWIKEFCGALVDSGMGIKYRVTSRVDTIDEEKLVLLKKSGCVRMSFGLESGSDRILKIMKKGTTVRRGKDAVGLARKYIDTIEASVMLGYQGEDIDTLAETVSLAKEIGLRPAVFFATPFPGTELYRNAVSSGKIKDEELYLMSLDKQLIFNMSINLTDMPDGEAFAAIGRSAKDIERYYIVRELFSFMMVRRVLDKIGRSGVKGMLTWIGKRLNETFLPHTTARPRQR